MFSDKKILNVLYQSDNNYAMVSGTSIASLLENNKHLEEINIFYCGYKIEKYNINNLKKIVQRYKNSSINFINTQEYHKIFRELNVKPWHGLYITWLKLLAFGDLDLKTDRVLYIDPHTIVNGSLDDLLELDFENNVMALSYDCLLNDHKKSIGLSETDGYFNCGIMLINHRRWKDEYISEKIKEHLREKSDYIIADQDLCNVMFKDQIKLLSSTYNFSSAYYAYNLRRLLKINNLKSDYFYSYDELMENYYCPKIVHSLFGITGKPWEANNKHPQRFLWEKYIKMTPWRDSNRLASKYNISRLLYNILPNIMFMSIYKTIIKRKYGK